MTRPMGEPAPSGRTAETQHAVRQLQRRPAPEVVGGSTEVVHMYSWDYDTVSTVATSTWTSVASFSAGGGYYRETFHVLDATTPAMSWDFKTGIIGLTVDGEFFASGWVRFSEDAQKDNELRAVAIRRVGGTERVIQTHRFDIADGSLAALRLPVHAHWLHGFGTIDLELQVWQNSGGNLTLVQAEFLVRRFEFETDGTYVVNDPFV
jgi:hypothetical protein